MWSGLCLMLLNSVSSERIHLKQVRRTYSDHSYMQTVVCLSFTRTEDLDV